MKKIMKKHRFLVPSLLVTAMLLLLVGGNQLLRAQQNGSVTINNYAEGGIVLQTSGESLGSEDFILGAVGTRFPNGLAVGSSATVNSAGEFMTTETSTIQIITRGSDAAKAMTFTAAATTTPGGLFSIQNTEVDKLCGVISIDFKTNGGADSVALQVAAATSTQASAWSSKTRTLVASTTIATTSAPLITNVTNPGTYVASDQDIGGELWLWSNGTYLLGALESNRTPDHASSTGYTSMAGTVQVDCVTR